MAHWDHGYVTDVVYTNNFYRETTPAWLASTALLLGHRPPDLAGAFRYADLGCGNGFTALTVAATSPQAEVWGFDFNPAHIEAAREPGGAGRPDQRAFRGGVLRRAGGDGRRGAAGIRLHRLAWRAELDLAGQPPADARR